jgi:hypothetical protein
MDSIAERLKIKEIYGHMFKGQEMVKPLSTNILL